jgi:hypothetical protein
VPSQAAGEEHNGAALAGWLSLDAGLGIDVGQRAKLERRVATSAESSNGEEYIEDYSTVEIVSSQAAEELLIPWRHKAWRFRRVTLRPVSGALCDHQHSVIS